MPNFWMIAAGLVLPGLMTGIGALPALFTGNVTRKWLDAMLGFAAGVMLAATCFSLILPSIEFGGGTFKAVLITGLGIIVGAVIIDLIDRFAPHEHLINKHHEGVAADSLKKIWLFIIAIAIHNFPEGMAVGVALRFRKSVERDSYRYRYRPSKHAGGTCCRLRSDTREVQCRESVLDCVPDRAD